MLKAALTVTELMNRHKAQFHNSRQRYQLFHLSAKKHVDPVGTGENEVSLVCWAMARDK